MYVLLILSVLRAHHVEQTVGSGASGGRPYGQSYLLEQWQPSQLVTLVNIETYHAVVYQLAGESIKDTVTTGHNLFVSPSFIPQCVTYVCDSSLPDIQEFPFPSIPIKNNKAMM